jgi:hypothetical protein
MSIKNPGFSLLGSFFIEEEKYSKPITGLDRP